MLLDLIRPGRPPQLAAEAQDARRAARLLGLLHRPLAIPDLIPGAGEELGWRFGRAHDQLESSFARDVVSHQEIEEAHHRALGLHAERPVTVPCHGDFLDKNILVDAAGEWWAIDPRPCRGDPCLDGAFWALAHRGGAGAARRAGVIAAAAGLDPERVTAWMRVFAVSEAVLARDAGWSGAYLEVLGARTSRSIR